MTALYDITAESLTQELGWEVPEAFVVVAKQTALGMDSDSMCEVMGCSKQQLAEITDDDGYKQVLGKIRASAIEESSSQTTGWDKIEQIAMTNLIKRLPYEKDGDFLLRVAAVANKAHRRHQRDTGILDPSTRQGATVITLTQRLTQHLMGNGRESRQIVKEISVTDGSMTNPSFAEVDSLLSVSSQPSLTPAQKLQNKKDPTLNELLDDMDKEFDL